MTQSPQDQGRLHAIVGGRVQGVGFRMFVLEAAQAMDLTGWVRNKYDGRVEVTAEGTHAQLEKLLDELRTGPNIAYVDAVEQEWLPATGEFRTFQVRRTE